MFSYSKDLHFDVVLPRVRAANMRQVYKIATGALATHAGVSNTLLMTRLQEPNRLNRACAGDGVVVADMKLKGLKDPRMALLALKDEVDFKAADGVAARLFCIMISPESHGTFHLCSVSRVMRLLKNDDVHQQLRSAKSEHEMRAVLDESERLMIAA